MRKEIHSWTKSTPQTSPGCGSLVPTSLHTASGEALIHAPWADAERANSVGICLANYHEPGSGPLKPK